MVVSTDWLVALLVTVTTTVVVYLIGRRLDGSAKAKANPAAATAPAASVPAAPAPAAPEKATARIEKAGTPDRAEKASERASAAAAAGSTPKPQTAKPKRAGGSDVARLEYEEDDEIDPTRVGQKAAAPPPVPQKVIYSPKVHPIVFDRDVESPEAAGSQFLVHARAQTDKGLRRKRNEDSLLVLDSESVFVIADGMGGYRGGELASTIAVKTIEDAYNARSFEGPAHEGVPADATNLARAIQMANSAILETANEKPELAGMGTTICAARFSPNKRRLFIGHVGDSRCYRLRDGVFKQMTADHTMADLGVTGPEAAQLSRAVGVWPTVPIDIVMGAPVPGDVYLLCSDGLTKMLKDDAIGAVVRTHEDPKAAVEELVRQANARGGKDNITVIIVRVTPPDRAPGSA